ncbi:UDP-N-acetylmuramate--L-alanine ligase [Algisphaera agarilytica]|uniref:UDP-N-acetylmuramate--L-alanine ligase n=1 Tax=Algisphaera agarilytica TaxID=1385975 RepID=A0A7X0H650_9BACT|nr:UDP-N-acetylmuramate--L-alanine ligase [Algisphaera agarilytica]MBB6429949.1 UDP-N-acetylmuramate--alanine ligase [Algisphaera agarilytica]
MPQPAASAAASSQTLAAQRLHFVGIGGSGMSGLAKLAKQRGAIVTGSDRATPEGGDSPAVAALRANGIDVLFQQTAESVPEACDTLVISAAIPPDHAEVVEARRRGVEVVKYAQMLGRLMASPQTTGVAIAGTHGKSTTTSILCHALLQSDLDPSFILGAHCEQIGGGSRAGNNGTLIAEACEYDRSFHNYRPTHATILNVEADHLDLYSSIDEIFESFATFARLIDPEGSLLIHHESPHRLSITAGLDAAVETLGFASQADWRIKVDGDQVTLHEHGKQVCAWTQPLPGDHFAYNAAAAAVTANRLGAPWDKIGPAITGFRGLDRRMQTVGSRGDILVLDDYGHHPTEIDTTLRALRQHHQPERLICVFQPHQHSRTRHLMEQFAVSFSAADIVIVPEIYFVRDSEKERQAVTAGALVDRLRKQGVIAMHLHPFEAIVEQLEVLTKPGDLVVTMGAGDVWKIGRAFLDTAD